MVVLFAEKIRDRKEHQITRNKILIQQEINKYKRNVCKKIWLYIYTSNLTNIYAIIIQKTSAMDYWFFTWKTYFKSDQTWTFSLINNKLFSAKNINMVTITVTAGLKNISKVRKWPSNFKSLIGNTFHHLSAEFPPKDFGLNMWFFW